MIKKLRITVEGKVYDVEVEILSEEGGNTPAATSAASTRSASLGDAMVSRPSAPAAPAAGPGAVCSPLTGRVVEISVGEGQDVKEGETLLTIEAMKMNTFVYAPRGGKISAVSVAVGDGVEEGQSLVTIQ